MLYLTGFSDRLFKEKVTLWADEAFLDKPCSVKGLLQAVALLLFGRVEAPEGFLREPLGGLSRMATNDTVERLAGGIAHDFNNLLTAIVGHVDVLSDYLSPGDPRAAEVTAIREAAELAADLTRQLVVFSRTQRLQPGGVESERGHRPHAGGAAAADWRAHRARDATRGRSCWPCERMPEQLEQIILNHWRSTRATRCRDGGVLTLETRTCRHQRRRRRAARSVEPGDYVELSVTDTGAGIAPDVQRAPVRTVLHDEGPPARRPASASRSVYGIGQAERRAHHRRERGAGRARIRASSAGARGVRGRRVRDRRRPARIETVLVVGRRSRPCSRSSATSCAAAATSCSRGRCVGRFEDGGRARRRRFIC